MSCAIRLSLIGSTAHWLTGSLALARRHARQNINLGKAGYLEALPLSLGGNTRETCLRGGANLYSLLGNLYVTTVTLGVTSEFTGLIVVCLRRCCSTSPPALCSSSQCRFTAEPAYYRRVEQGYMPTILNNYSRETKPVP